MGIFDTSKKLFEASGTRLHTSVAGTQFTVEIKGDHRGNVILQKQINGFLGRPPVKTDFLHLRNLEAIPFGSIIGRLDTGGNAQVQYRVRTGRDVLGEPEFETGD